MKYPQIPTDRKLSATELRAFAREIKKVAKDELANPALSAEDEAEVKTQLAIAGRLINAAELAEETETEEAAEAERARQAEEAAKGAGDGDGGSGDGTGDGGTGAGDGGEGGDGDAGDGGDDGLGGRGGTKLATSTGQQAITKPGTGRTTQLVDVLTAASEVTGKKPGEGFSTWTELAAAVHDRASNINAHTFERIPVGIVKANYPAERTMGESAQLNLKKFEPDEIQAALCAPATPYYDLHCMNTTRRPVFNGLPQFAAPRMKVSIMPSPTLSQITTGYGVWSAANEASLNDTKSPCQTITCGSPTEFQAYGIYRCLTVRNMLAMSYPELVEAWLNRLHAAQSRLAEQQLLNAMGTAATAISAPTLGYGASTTIASTLLNYLGLFQETQRWDLTDNMDIWGHRWILQALKMEIVRRRNTSGTPTSVPTDETVNAMFRNAGFNPHWVLDTATWMEAVPALASSGVLNRFPANVNFLIHAPGKFAVMDRGELRIGVTGNGIYRDNQSNSRNEYTYFVESFEGLVDTGECGAHVLTIPVCWNGAQIDDIVINCQGGDEAGYQS